MPQIWQEVVWGSSVNPCLFPTVTVRPGQIDRLFVLILIYTVLSWRNSWKCYGLWGTWWPCEVVCLAHIRTNNLTNWLTAFSGSM